ncbi:MAG: D-glycero-beta-D-manno-heptose-7-phosphate kinase [Bacteroidales bacterium]|nr:D-glycero-beta-D-manno-heptose-7-phosphate kinase [Bacteroidales bacterium]
MIADVLARFRGSRVLVVGDLMLDEFVWGNVSRISPEAPVPVVEVNRRTYSAGGAANTALNIVSLSGRVTLAGVVGDDGEGAKVCSILGDRGADLTCVIRDADRPTSTKTRILAQTQQVVRFDHECSADISPFIADQLLTCIDDTLPDIDCCVISDYGKGVVIPRIAQQIIALTHEHGIPTIVDPKGIDYVKYRGATLIKPNQLEAGKVLNRELRSDDDVHRAGSDLLDILGSRSSVLITRGPQGMNLFERGRYPYHVPTRSREVYDVTGAGDTVAGTIALSMAVGAPLPVACELASLAAAIVVGKIGTAACSIDELRSSVLATNYRAAS